jgi:hypothetical protein
MLIKRQILTLIRAPSVVSYKSSGSETLFLSVSIRRERRAYNGQVVFSGGRVPPRRDIGVAVRGLM